MDFPGGFLGGSTRYGSVLNDDGPKRKVVWRLDPKTGRQVRVVLGGDDDSSSSSDGDTNKNCTSSAAEARTSTSSTPTTSSTSSSSTRHCMPTSLFGGTFPGRPGACDSPPTRKTVWRKDPVTGKHVKVVLGGGDSDSERDDKTSGAKNEPTTAETKPDHIGEEKKKATAASGKKIIKKRIVRRRKPKPKQQETIDKEKLRLEIALLEAELERARLDRLLEKKEKDVSATDKEASTSATKGEAATSTKSDYSQPPEAVQASDDDSTSSSESAADEDKKSDPPASSKKTQARHWLDDSSSDESDSSDEEPLRRRSSPTTKAVIAIAAVSTATTKIPPSQQRHRETQQRCAVVNPQPSTEKDEGNSTSSENSVDDGFSSFVSRQSVTHDAGANIPVHVKVDPPARADEEDSSSSSSSEEVGISEKDPEKSADGCDIKPLEEIPTSAIGQSDSEPDSSSSDGESEDESPPPQPVETPPIGDVKASCSEEADSDDDSFSTEEDEAVPTEGSLTTRRDKPEVRQPEQTTRGANIDSDSDDSDVHDSDSETEEPASLESSPKPPEQESNLSSEDDSSESSVDPDDEDKNSGSSPGGSTEIIGKEEKCDSPDDVSEDASDSESTMEQGEDVPVASVADGKQSVNDDRDFDSRKETGDIPAAVPQADTKEVVSEADKLFLGESLEGSTEAPVSGPPAEENVSLAATRKEEEKVSIGSVEQAGNQRLDSNELHEGTDVSNPQRKDQLSTETAKTLLRGGPKAKISSGKDTRRAGYDLDLSFAVLAYLQSHGFDKASIEMRKVLERRHKKLEKKIITMGSIRWEPLFVTNVQRDASDSEEEGVEESEEEEADDCEDEEDSESESEEEEDDDDGDDGEDEEEDEDEEDVATAQAKRGGRRVPGRSKSDDLQPVEAAAAPQRKLKRSVSFDDNIVTRIVPRYTMDEKLDVFYDKTDITAFKFAEECRRSEEQAEMMAAMLQGSLLNQL